MVRPFTFHLATHQTTRKKGFRLRLHFTLHIVTKVKLMDVAYVAKDIAPRICVSTLPHTRTNELVDTTFLFFFCVDFRDPLYLWEAEKRPTQ